MIREVIAWLDDRLDLTDVRHFVAEKGVPVHAQKVWYYLGGMTLFLFGVQVLTDEGGDVSLRRAALRTLAFPLSFVILGLGFLGILLGEQRRALHDVIAGTVVVYSWDARAARLRFLSRESSPGAGRPSPPALPGPPASPG